VSLCSCVGFFRGRATVSRAAPPRRKAIAMPPGTDARCGDGLAGTARQRAAAGRRPFLARVGPVDGRRRNVDAGPDIAAPMFRGAASRAGAVAAFAASVPVGARR